MKAVNAKITRAFQKESRIPVCDNSGAKVIRFIAPIGKKGRKGRHLYAGVGDMIVASVVSGTPEMKKQVVYAIIVRQKKEYRRKDGTRIAFEDNAAVVLKDEKGNPKGTLIKGPIAKEAAEKWPGVAKIASMVV